VAIETLLGEMGITVGATLSPHVHRFNERVRIAGNELDDAALCEAFAAVEAARCGRVSAGSEDSAVPLTYFEFATLVALEAFRQACVDIAVLEVGLGGRLDAFNIIDVMDGLSAGVAFMCSLAIFVVGVLNDSMTIAIMAASLGGCLLGFLRYNFEPAKIYMGDTGSMFIGMMLGALAMIGNYTTHNLMACISPVLILGVPIFDTFFVMYIRYLRGMSIISGSPDHFALRLRKWRLTTKQTVVASYGISLLLGCAALFIMQLAHLQALVVVSTLITIGLITGYLLKKVDMTL